MLLTVSKNSSLCVMVELLPTKTEIFFTEYFPCESCSIHNYYCCMSYSVGVFLAMSLNRIICCHSCILKRDTIRHGVFEWKGSQHVRRIKKRVLLQERYNKTDKE